MSDASSIISTVSDYYSAAIERHGITAKGVDWNSEESQYARFTELCKVFDREQSGFSLLDFGCGWGALLDFIQQNYPSAKVDYTGYDIVPKMLESAKQKHNSQGTWISSLSQTAQYNSVQYDFVLASGIFNVRQQHTDTEWQKYLESTLNQFNQISKKGFSFNMLTSYSDADKKRDYLYYADPCKTFDYCKRNFSKNVALLHDYPLYEFTILVRK